MFDHTIKDTHTRIMSEFEIVYTHLCFQPQPSWDPSLLLRNKTSSLCLMLVNLPTLLHLLLVFICLPYPEYAPKSGLSFRKLLEVVCPGQVNQPLSTSIVCKHLKKTGMKAVVKSKCALLSVEHCKACLDFAYAYKDWTLEDWKKVVWSNETKINCLGSDGCKWVWKKAGEGLSDRLVEDTVKFGGGSLMMWGYISWQGVGYAAKIDGRMDGDLYL